MLPVNIALQTGSLLEGKDMLLLLWCAAHAKVVYVHCCITYFTIDAEVAPWCVSTKHWLVESASPSAQIVRNKQYSVRVREVSSQPSLGTACPSWLQAYI